MGINGQRKDQWLQLDLRRCESSIWSPQTLLLKVSDVDSLLLSLSLLWFVFLVRMKECIRTGKESQRERTFYGVCSRKEKSRSGVKEINSVSMQFLLLSDLLKVTL